MAEFFLNAFDTVGLVVGRASGPFSKTHLTQRDFSGTVAGRKL